MATLIDRARHTALVGYFEAVEDGRYATLSELADALAKLRAYAVHSTLCASSRDVPCFCGLTKLLKDIGDD